ncbi:MAG: hypothetical protein HYX68_29645 [Planctomycetes bacterium]|jgi:hypothetical protein|nr:hypothetical protein [Planctomycetota bacterium]
MADPSLDSVTPRRGLGLSAWCVVAAFGAYFCMYGFRKPFTAGLYDDYDVGGISWKTVLLAAQVLGYTLSKFIGIKVIAEMPPVRRVVWLFTLIGAAEAALLMFAIVPRPWSCFFLFLNGLPLGMVFGLVLGFLEGRRHTEALTAGLCVSFIVADGFSKTIGSQLLLSGVTESWMPFVAGIFFAPPFLLSLWMLSRIPPPSRVDVAERCERLPMNRQERGKFFSRYAAGLVMLILLYLLLTILRTVRADFAPEIWAGLGTTDEPAIFTISEIAVGVLVMLASGLIVFVRAHRLAFFGALSLALVGALLAGAALGGLSAGILSPLGFMILHGLGLYLPYVVFHTTVFERLIALTRDRGNIGYLMYLADAFGYLGVVAVMVAKNLFGDRESFLDFFILLSWIVAGAGILLMIPCWWYFATHPATAAVVELEPIQS